MAAEHTVASLPPLASPDRLAARVGVAADDPLLTEMLDSASARFRGAVGHPVTRVDNDRVRLDGNGATILLLPAAPVVSISEVTVNGGPVEDYEWSATGVLYRRRRWPHRLGAVTVTYTHGYEQPPGDVAEVVLDQAATMWHNRPGLSQVQTASESVSFGTTASVGTTAQWASAVERYRLGRGDRP